MPAEAEEQRSFRYSAGWGYEDDQLRGGAPGGFGRPKKPVTRRILPSVAKSMKSTLSGVCVPSALINRQLNRQTR